VTAEVAGKDPAEGTGAPDRGAAGGTVRYPRRSRIDPFGLFPVVLLGAIVAAIVVLQPSLATASFLETKTNAAVSLILVTMGQTLVILTGGIDLSVGGVISVTNALAATQMHDDPVSIVLWSVLIALFGLGAGLINGFIVAVMRVTPFIATLATWSIWSGAALLVLEQDGGRVAPGFRAIVRTHAGPIPGSLLIIIGLVVIWVLLKRSRLGARIYAVGSDARAAARSGAQVRRTLFVVYGLSGLLAAMAGLYRVVQVGSGSPVAGDGFILTSVAAVLIGGTSLAGGRGGFGMSLTGVLILLSLNDLIFFAGVSTFYTPMVQGALLVAAVAINAVGYRLSLRRAQT